MEKDPRDVIIRPVITEHSYDAMENNVYTFELRFARPSRLSST